MPDQTRPAILVLGTADWNQPIATNQHYVVRELCKSDADITFVESLALRRPTLSRRDLKRVASRVAAATARRKPGPESPSWRDVPSSLKVLSPIVIPIHSGPSASVNRWLISRTVDEWLTHPGPRILWCYTPTTYGLEDVADATIYHCVDLLGDVPGIDAAVIRKNERALAATRATAIATSEVVRSHLVDQGFKDVQLWENVADVDVFSSALTPGEERHPGRVVFAGNLSPSKVDYPLLRALSAAGLDVRVAGPRAEGGGKDQDQFDSLIAAGITYLGMLSIVELATELARAEVGLIPYVINPYTRGVSPLKTYEYLAAGLSVVATDLPGVSPDGVDIFKESTRDGFVDRVRSLAGRSQSLDVARRTGIADIHSWRHRGQQARDLLTAHLVPSHARGRD